MGNESAAIAIVQSIQGRSEDEADGKDRDPLLAGRESGRCYPGDSGHSAAPVALPLELDRQTRPGGECKRPTEEFVEMRVLLHDELADVRKRQHHQETKL